MRLGLSALRPLGSRDGAPRDRASSEEKCAAPYFTLMETLNFKLPIRRSILGVLLVE